jgi:hypothetical protein
MHENRAVPTTVFTALTLLLAPPVQGIRRKRRCRELNETKITPDYRHDAHNLYTQFDTYRGRRIQALYEVSNESSSRRIQ